MGRQHSQGGMGETGGAIKAQGLCWGIFLRVRPSLGLREGIVYMVCPRPPGERVVGERGTVRDVLEGGSEGGGWLGPPLLLGSPYGPRRRRSKNFEA